MTEATARDTTDEWLLPEGAAPPLLSELERRIDEALIVARASEKAAIEIGGAAVEAAQQARRAAEIAERATAAVLNGNVATAASPEPAPDPGGGEDAALRSFSERADRVVARLRALERRSRRGQPASVGAGRRRPGG